MGILSHRQSSIFLLYTSYTSAFLLFISDTVVLPSSEENTFFIFDMESFLTIAAIEGPLPETEAPKAPFSINFGMIFGSELSMVDEARPFRIIAFQ